MGRLTCYLPRHRNDVLLGEEKMKKLISQILAGLFFVTAIQSHASLIKIPAALEELPIQENGRRKPYLVFAEETLRALSGRTSLIW